MTVHAVGIDREGNIEYARNGNETECKDIIGACGCIHAETRLLQKMHYPEKVILSHSPCVPCARALLEAGVQEVLYVEEYRLKDGINILEKNYVKVECIGEADVSGD
jgi:deoxycytidylate deaminase